MQFCVPHLPPPPSHLPPEATHPWLDLALAPEATHLALASSAVPVQKPTRSDGGGGGGGGDGDAVVDVNDLSHEHRSVVEGTLAEGSLAEGSLGGGSLEENIAFGSTPVPSPPPPPPRYILTGRINGNLFEYSHTQKDLDENTFDTSMLGTRDSSAGGTRRALNVGVRDVYFPADPPSTVNISPVYKENEDLAGRVLPDNRSLGYGLAKFYEDNNRAVGTFSYHKATESSSHTSVSSLSLSAATTTTTGKHKKPLLLA